MKQKEKIAFILDTLEKHFPDPKPALHFTDSFTLLVAVLLSAQCTDERVNRVTPRLFALANTPQKMAQLPLEVIEKTIYSLGFFRMKAKNLQALSKILVEKFGGEVPTTLEELETLPGVGHKTASVVLAQGFGEATFPVDTHIHRLAKRWGLSSGKDVVTTEKDLKRLFPKKTWSKEHLQFILYGRTFCKARCHHIGQCPICHQLSL